MAFVKSLTIGDLVGKWVVLTEAVSTMSGTFEAGTRVKITGTDLVGAWICFSFEDEEGNRAVDVPGSHFNYATS